MTGIAAKIENLASYVRTTNLNRERDERRGDRKAGMRHVPKGAKLDLLRVDGGDTDRALHATGRVPTGVHDENDRELDPALGITKIAPRGSLLHERNDAFAWPSTPPRTYSRDELEIAMGPRGAPASNEVLRSAGRFATTVDGQRYGDTRPGAAGRTFEAFTGPRVERQPLPASVGATAPYIEPYAPHPHKPDTATEYHGIGCRCDNCNNATARGGKWWVHTNARPLTSGGSSFRHNDEENGLLRRVHEDRLQRLPDSPVDLARAVIELRVGPIDWFDIIEDVTKAIAASEHPPRVALWLYAAENKRHFRGGITHKSVAIFAIACGLANRWRTGRAHAIADVEKLIERERDLFRKSCAEFPQERRFRRLVIEVTGVPRTAFSWIASAGPNPSEESADGEDDHAAPDQLSRAS